MSASPVAVAVLTVVHLFSGKLRSLRSDPRGVWLSSAGGVSVAYVFVHLLPELADGQEAVAKAAGESLPFLNVRVYLVALMGLAAFYGLDRLTAELRRRRHKAGQEDSTGAGVFWVHISPFAVYNALTGYLLLRRLGAGLVSLALFAFAMGVHSLVNDYGLRRDHKERYHRLGR